VLANSDQRQAELSDREQAVERVERLEAELAEKLNRIQKWSREVHLMALYGSGNLRGRL
jgi:hypothetical protein